ncbi:MAG: hypothetical protein MUD10_04635 [Candidatus Pacebacteria bacterium]|jgi:hypothetical protein|nr:hypothetical protein [Candidatus Paceibacterota bacterium]
MGIKQRYRQLVEKSSQRSLKINAVIFAVLWTIYIIASCALCLLFGYGDFGGGTIALIFFCQLFYIAFGLAVLAKWAVYRIRTKGLPIKFYPAIALKLTLVPQAMALFFYFLINWIVLSIDYLAELADSESIYSWSAPFAGIFALIVLIAAFAALIVSAVLYLKGLVIFSKKIFELQTFEPARGRFWGRARGAALFWVFFIAGLALVICGLTVVQSFYNLVGGFSRSILCSAERESAFCSWLDRQCWAVVEGYRKDDCYFIMAQEKRDPVICEKIAEGKYADSCRFGLAYDEAVEKKDLSVCDNKIYDTGKKDVCYNAVARATRDWSICDKITTQKSKCSCYGKKAFALKDPSLCEQCNDDEIFTSDYADCYYQIARENQDPSICGMVQRPEGKCMCYENVAEDLKDPSLCEQCRDCADCKATNYEECLSDVAQVKRDQSICGAIQDQNTKDDCYYWVADRKNDASVCDAILDGFEQGKCRRNAVRR